MDNRKGYLALHLNQHGKKYSSRFSNIQRENKLFINEVIQFHYSPSDLDVSYPTGWKSKNTKGAAIKDYEYTGAKPVIVRLKKLLFNDLFSEENRSIQPSRENANETIDRAISKFGESDFENVFQGAFQFKEQRGHRRSCEDCVLQLTEWVTPHGEVSPPLLELINVMPGKFVCYISNFQATETNWHPVTKRLLRAFVDIELTQYFLSNNLQGTGGNGGLGALDYRMIAEDRLKRKTQIASLTGS